MRIRYGYIVIAALMSAGLPAWSADGTGLQANDSSWFHGRWQARIELSQGASGHRHIDPYNLAADTTRNSLRGLTVLRDYYFEWGDPPELAPAAVGGLRATGGLVVTPRSAAASASSRRVGTYRTSASGLTGRAIASGWSDPNNDVIPVPYVGLGYTDLPSRTGGWGFRADLGLMALSPQSAVKFGNALSGAQGIDDLLRDMRLSPLIQIGVSYSF
jgi:hypothetical protein